MGWRLAEHCQDYAPANLTWRERYVLSALAGAAYESGEHERECRPGIENEPDLIRRIRCSSRTQRFTVLAALVDKGALKQVQRGQKHRAAVYKIPDFQRPVFPDAEPSTQGPANRDAEPSSQGPGSRDAENSQGPGSGLSGSRFRNPQGPVNWDSHSSYNQEIPKDPNKSLRNRAIDPYAEPGFEDFWEAYPRKIAKGAAAKAWPAALRRCGGDPALIIKGAEAYWRQTGREDRFTAYPATWLNADRWLDEPEPSQWDRALLRARASDTRSTVEGP
jgi:hypothetical protein